MIRFSANVWIPRLVATVASMVWILQSGQIPELGENSSGSNHWAFNSPAVQNSSDFSEFDDFVNQQLVKRIASHESGGG